MLTRGCREYVGCCSFTRAHCGEFGRPRGNSEKMFFRSNTLARAAQSPERAMPLHAVMKVFTTSKIRIRI